MGSGNRRGGIEGSSSSLECDVGLGLKMQNTESYPHHLPYHHPDSSITTTTTSCSSSFSGGYGGRSGPSSFVTYDAVGATGSVSGGGSVFRRTCPFTSSDTSFKSTGKILFTASQWQELERQTMIYKYMMASIPVPPELLIPFTKNPPVSQSNSLDLRFSSGSDLEPWRCRRTDGKKWRCSRDVAPEQKYCERHAHKTRTRSRKPVENQTQISNTTKANNYTNRPPILPAYTIDPFQKPISHFQTPASAVSFDQARCIEWFMKGGTTTNQQQYHHHHHQSSSSSSSRIGFKRDITDHTKNPNPPFFHQYEEEQTPVNFTNPYIINGQDSPRFESHQLTNCLDDTTHTTRHFIDAWSTAAEREDLNSSARKLPLSSLTLSMSGSDGAHEDSVGMEGERGLLKSHWLNQAMWMGSPPPGGPLGEALCLGPAAVAGPNVPLPHGYSTSNNTSSCSKSSCEDGGHGINFH